MGVRHIQVLLLFFMSILMYGTRSNLSIAIVAMTDPTVNPGVPTYNWKDKGTILSSFFWGYVFTQPIAGTVVKRFGTKKTIACGMFVNGICTIMIPVLAPFGSIIIIVCRIFQGFGQGFLYPSSHGLLILWIPLLERARMGGFVYAGGPLGTVISFPLTGTLCHCPLGWPAAFYFYGGASTIWALVWLRLGYSSPHMCKRITESELDFISSNTHEAVDIGATPWKQAFSSLPVWSIIIVLFGQNWGFWTLATLMPNFMSKVLKFDIRENGLLSGAPYLALWILSFFFSYFADTLINTGTLNVTATRKIMSSIGLVIPAGSFVLLSYLDQSQVTLAVVLLIIAVGVNSAIFSGLYLNPMDICPNHCAQIFGVMSGLANFASFLSPLAAQVVISDEYSPQQWNNVFLLAAAVYLATLTFYVCFAQGRQQSWDGTEAMSITSDLSYAGSTMSAVSRRSSYSAWAF